MKNKAYTRSPCGQHVERFLRQLRWEGASDHTLDSYETTLARLAIDHDDFENGLQSFCDMGPAGTEYIREFLDRHWGHLSGATKVQRLAAVKSLFKWAAGEGIGICDYNPAAPIRRPRTRAGQERVAYAQTVLYDLVRAQPSLRDQVCLQLLGRMGLRKNELRLLKVGEIDLIRDLLIVHGKGRKVAVLPLTMKSLRDDLYLHIQGDSRRPDEHLLYPRGKKREPMHPASIHRWFKRCLTIAGLPTSMKLHELRHTAADHIYRQTGDIVRAQQLLRHEHVSTTEGYIHPTRRDLGDALRAIDEVWARGN